MLLHRRAGARVVVAHVTDGRTSRALGLEPAEMARRRRVEAENCARVLGLAGFEWIGLRGGEWTDDQLVSAMADVTRRHRPDLVYAPSLVDFHPEHVQTARAMARFWTKGMTPEAVRIYPIQVPLTALLANVVVDITSEVSRVSEAMNAFTTQSSNIPRTWRERRYAARRYRTAKYAEEFWELSPATYVSLHSSVQPATVRFRGMRESAVFDPLAYLVGRSGRRRLSATARRLASTTS
jgi:LmbE family N-acetylglucosaminyl deacetylase